jgi:hypothetical protein
VQQRSTDVNLTCRCPDCGSREVRITPRRYRGPCRLPSPAHERAVHELLSRGGDTKITNR